MTPSGSRRWLAVCVVSLLVAPALAVCPPDVAEQESFDAGTVYDEAYDQCDCHGTKPAAFASCVRKVFKQAIRAKRVSACWRIPPTSLFGCSVELTDRSICAIGRCESVEGFSTRRCRVSSCRLLRFVDRCHGRHACVASDSCLPGGTVTCIYEGPAE